jgi:hypothetical protein
MVGDGVSVGDSVGDGDVSVGEGEVSVGDGEVSVGDGEVSVGEGEVSVGEGEVSVGDGVVVGGVVVGLGEVGQGEVVVEVGLVVPPPPKVGVVGVGLSDGIGGSVRSVGPTAVSVEPGTGVGVGEFDWTSPVLLTLWFPDCLGEGLSWMRTAASTKAIPTPFSHR